MALLKFKTPEDREIATLKEIEKRITRRERIHKILIGSLSVLLLASCACHIARCKDTKKRFF